jgi:N-acyl-phosphatidylethanolamine-hydrolysing phospholipase D
MLAAPPSPLQWYARGHFFNRNVALARLTALLLALTGCAGVNAQHSPTPPHHTAEGFKNNDIAAIDKSFGELIRWQRERRAAGLPKPPRVPTPSQAPDIAALQGYTGESAQAPAITWIGHASMLVQSGGLNVLTDPIFSSRASPISLIGPVRKHPPGVALADMPVIDVVLISHNHYDHLDRPSVLEIAQRARDAGQSTLFLVPLGMKSWFTDMGIADAVELDWWDTYHHKGVEFNFTPIQHWSARSFTDRSQTLWGGFAVFAPDLHWYFAGDTGYSTDFADTGTRYADRHTASQGGSFDLALIPIGAYEPRWFLKDQHVNPQEAVQIHRDLRAKRSVGIHWGTFELSDESLDQPPLDLALAARAQGLADGDFSVMALGETRVLAARQSSPAPQQPLPQ